MMWRDVSDEVELKNGKANPFGWSQYEMWHNGAQIGWIESGSPSITAAGYQYTLVPEGENQRLVVECEIVENPVIPA